MILLTILILSGAEKGR